MLTLILMIRNRGNWVWTKTVAVAGGSTTPRCGGDRWWVTLLRVNIQLDLMKSLIICIYCDRCFTFLCWWRLIQQCIQLIPILFIGQLSFPVDLSTLCLSFLWWRNYRFSEGWNSPNLFRRRLKVILLTLPQIIPFETLFNTRFPTSCWIKPTVSHFRLSRGQLRMRKNSLGTQLWPRSNAIFSYWSRFWTHQKERQHRLDLYFSLLKVAAPPRPA